MPDVFVFGKGVNVTRLNREIVSDPVVTPNPTSITARSGLAAIDVTISFPSSLTVAAEDALSGVVSGHIPIPVIRIDPANVTTINGLSGAIELVVSENAIVNPQQLDDRSGLLSITTGIPSASGALIDSQGTTITELSATSGFFGTAFQQVCSAGESSTSAAGYQQKLRLTTEPLVSGLYRIGWSYEERVDDESGPQNTFRVQLDDSLVLMEVIGVLDSHSEDRFNPAAGFVYQTLSSGIHTIDLDFRSPEADMGAVARIRRACLEIWRVA